jgi:hypothetical protein
MTITSFAGIGRLPEVSIPGADIDGIVIGVSLPFEQTKEGKSYFTPRENIVP